MPNEAAREAQRRWSTIEDRVLRAFLGEIEECQNNGIHLTNTEWQFVAVRCAKRLLESAETSLHTQVLRLKAG